MIADLRSRIAGESGRAGPPRRRRPLRLSHARLRTLVLPALAVFLLVHFTAGSGAPFGVRAAFHPGDGDSFAGVARLGPGEAAAVPVEPGDLVGTTAGSPGRLLLGEGDLELQVGARALVESLVPPRVRLVAGRAVARGPIRVMTANGVVELTEGEAEVAVTGSGLRVLLARGAGTIVSSAGTEALALGEERLVR